MSEKMKGTNQEKTHLLGNNKVGKLMKLWIIYVLFEKLYLAGFLTVLSP